MIWFFSWATSIVFMCIGSAIYLWVLHGDPQLFTRELNDLSISSRVWRPGAYAMPAIEAVIYLVCLAFAWWKRDYFRTSPRGEADAASGDHDQLAARVRAGAVEGLMGVAYLLFANPAGRRLTQWYLPLVGAAVALSAPLVQVSGVLSPFVWGFCMLFAVTLIGTSCFPDPADKHFRAQASPLPPSPPQGSRWWTLSRWRG